MINHWMIDEILVSFKLAPSTIKTLIPEKTDTDSSRCLDISLDWCLEDKTAFNLYTGLRSQVFI